MNGTGTEGIVFIKESPKAYLNNSTSHRYFKYQSHLKNLSQIRNDISIDMALLGVSSTKSGIFLLALDEAVTNVIKHTNVVDGQKNPDDSVVINRFDMDDKEYLLWIFGTGGGTLSPDAIKQKIERLEATILNSYKGEQLKNFYSGMGSFLMSKGADNYGFGWNKKYHKYDVFLSIYKQ